jgi:hypothetical protein
MDREGIVHLQGVAVGGGATKVVFQLPPGYRPGSGKVVNVPALCGGCSGPTETLIIFGSNSGEPGLDGGVLMDTAVAAMGLDGVSFRAES